jgi:hypothetical protein
VANRKLLGLIAALGLAAGAAAQLPREVVRCRLSGRPLSARLEWGFSESASRGYHSGFWVGYSIRRLMGERSSIGTFGTDGAGHQTLEEIIAGRTEEFPGYDGRYGVRRQARRVLEDIEKKGQPDKKVWKDVAVLSRWENPGERTPVRIDMSSLDLPFDFGGLPFIWLDGAEDGESLAWLKAALAGSRSEEAKKHVLAAVGMHQSPALVLPILEAALAGRESVSLRKDAAFWIGQQNDPRACAILAATARSDRSLEVRKHAVFALSQVDLEDSVDGLIALARTADEAEVRKQAVFWLAEKASKKALAALGEIADRDPETAVQEQALFALSEFHDKEAIGILIRVAKTHPNARLRKRAIFWLGESGDPRAVEALIEIVKKD